MGRLNRIKNREAKANEPKEPGGSPWPSLLVFLAIALSCCGLVWGAVEVTRRVPNGAYLGLSGALFIGGISLMFYYFKRWGAI